MERIRAVVVDHDGGEMTLRCIERLLSARPTAEAELEVVLVDNASHRPVTAEVAQRWPEVACRESAVNLGFGGGCNLALRDLTGIDYVALVNNDLFVADGWLDPLLAAVRSDPSVAAASPKMLFAEPHVEILLDSDTIVAGRGDTRRIGVRVLAAAMPGNDDVRIQVVHGFHSPEPPRTGSQWFRWTAGAALLRLPVGEGVVVPSCRLRLGADRPMQVMVTCGDASTALVVGPGDGWYDVPIGARPIEVINNAGSEWRPDGYGADRAFLAADKGQFDAPGDVELWSGGAVLLRGAYLADVGLFDERLFLYYEDLELSVRGSRRGWRYRYVPDSVVRHAHSATAVEGSPLARYYNERNRLLVLLRHRGVGPTMQAVMRYVTATLSYVRRDVLFRLLRGQRPRPDVAVGRARSLLGFIRWAPAMMRSRRADAKVLPLRRER